MSAPGSAREALIAETLGDIAILLSRVEATVSLIDTARMALDNAASELDHRLRDFETGMSAVTQHVKIKAVEHIVRRAGDAANVAIDRQARSMELAAQRAFSAQVDANLARLSRSLEQALQRFDRPREHWWTHAVTALASVVGTWWAVSSFMVR